MQILSKIGLLLKELSLGPLLVCVLVSYRLKLSLLRRLQRFRSSRLQVLRWHGQLGNNLIQIAHARYISNIIGAEIMVPPHSFLSVEKVFELHNDLPNHFLADFLEHRAHRIWNWGIWVYKALDNFLNPHEFLETYALSRNFFYLFEIAPFVPTLSDYRSLLREQLPGLINYLEDSSIDNDTLVIHIRSGDIFRENCKDKTYVQPPFSFYARIIDSHHFSKIVIVTQSDLRNPCIQKIRDSYPNVRVQSSDLQSDIDTILSARNLVAGMGTFAITLALSSSFIKRLFVPQFETSRHFLDIYEAPQVLQLYKSLSFKNALDFEVCVLEVSGYIRIGEWENTQPQRELMIKHSPSRVAFL